VIKELDVQFVDRCIKTTFMVAIITGLFVANYYQPLFAAGLLLGAGWNIVNLWFIKELVLQTITPNKVNKTKMIILGLVKFPLLYLLGYLLLTLKNIPVLSILTGFLLLFLVIFLKVVGILILTKNSKN
jgi:hypothetical protein